MTRYRPSPLGWLSAAVALLALLAPLHNASAADSAVHHRRATIDGVEVFYREAGPANGPVVVLLHGFPSSSHMFRNLIPALSDRYRVIAPDYPGFGESAMPDRAQFNYSFSRFAEITDALLVQLGARNYTLYVMDYGAPVGYRLALLHPERITGLVVQNGNAYAEGLLDFWAPIKAYWASGSKEHREALRAGTTVEATRSQYVDGVKDPTLVDPAAWVYDQARLERPGNIEIQLDLFYDYRTNVDLYPRFQKFFRERKPPTLIVWGANDKIFPAEGARAYRKDLPDAEFHLLDTGHFALEDKGAEIAKLMRGFLDRKVARR